MPLLTPLNLEQSIARYLADQFKAEGYNIYWRDTGQTESVSGSYTVTLTKQFPTEATNFANHGESAGPTVVNVPAFAVYCDVPQTDPSTRQGIGEGVFEWEADINIDGFADDELQWYIFKGLFKDWFGNPDVYVTLYDYQSDLSDPNPSAADGWIQFINGNVLDSELSERPAVRYYLNINATALFVE